ncbi:MAG: fatty acid cis/trans isomerase [Pseudomonadota bacterium]
MSLLVLASSCSLGEKPPVTEQQADVDFDLLTTLPEAPISYARSVRPILEKRCVACHGCYDAACQLKLTSLEGIHRGLSKELVYDGARISGVEPTRLFIDASTTEEWRAKGFHPVLNETDDPSPESNLRNSVLYQALRLKQLNPQPRIGMLPETTDISLDRSQVCPAAGEFDAFSEANPGWGMPYGMPNLNDQDYRTIVQWLAQGAPASESAEISRETLTQIDVWESFLNGPSNKQRLVSRYIYEHLFLGHIHFEGAPEREFFRLVRSSTPPGETIQEIPTVRPFDDPGKGPFYYRLRPYEPIVVAKNHVVYQWSAAKLARYQELFLEPDYRVTTLPLYAQEGQSNPFKVFEPIPPVSRYRFLLDDARFFIEGFIKGPVCRGQIALNVIEDQFWVMFFDPDKVKLSLDPDFLNRMSDYLETPADQGDTLQLLAIWRKFWKQQKEYLAAKQAAFEKIHTHDLDDAMSYLWDGDGENPNAALTVFRHFDSASVRFGFLGDYPETAWVLDYPVFERIHYLLVAGFNVYGNVGHQLNTRLYMDFLRMEGEDHFLVFLPAEHRKEIRDSWYVGVRETMNDEFQQPLDWLSVQAVVGYQSDDPQRELYQNIEQRLGPLGITNESLYPCGGRPCTSQVAGSAEKAADQAMARVAAIQGAVLQIFPDLAFLRVRTPEGERDLAYSLIRNRQYKNISSIFQDEANADPNEDTLTVIKGIEGSYPQFFFDIDIAEVERFAELITRIKTREDYEIFVSHFGLRRTNHAIWDLADWFNAEYAREKPIQAGILDLSRYQNR